MAGKGVQILTPVGRLVQGSPFEAQTLDAEGRPLVIKGGRSAGQARVSYFVAIAIPKTDPGVNALHAAIVDVARTAFPQFFDAEGNCLNPKFAFKITDGDSTVPNAKGRKPCDQEGFKGCWVFKFNNGFAPKCYTKGGAAVITSPTAIRPGYYIRVYATVAGNDSQQQPGVFLNCSMIELIGYGEEIVFGPSGEEVFGGAPVTALPPGASAMPIAPATAIPMPPVAAPLPPAAAPLPPAVRPAPDFLNPPGAPPMPPAPPVSESYVGTDGQVRPKAVYIAAGWTEAQIASLKRA